jgi:hypothetical protein
MVPEGSRDDEKFRSSSMSLGPKGGTEEGVRIKIRRSLFSRVFAGGCSAEGKALCDRRHCQRYSSAGEFRRAKESERRIKRETTSARQAPDAALSLSSLLN